MPLYEYECKECGLRFERRQSFSDERIKICPECEGPVIRLIQPAGIIFKGSGFYVTDNRTPSSTAVPGSRKDEPEAKGESSSSSSPSTSSASSNGDGKE